MLTCSCLCCSLACKEIHSGGYRYKRLKTLEAFMIILGLLELLYLLSLHAGILGENYGPSYNGTGTRAGPKNSTYGTPAAAAV